MHYLGPHWHQAESGTFFQLTNQELGAERECLPHVLKTSHQAFLTNEALQNIALTTMKNSTAWAAGDSAPH
jgi:lactate dehydrogenase-like 2-hydroxyacid dehydrogenase